MSRDSQPWLADGEEGISALFVARPMLRRGRARLATLAPPILALTGLYVAMTLVHVLLAGREVPPVAVSIAATAIWLALVVAAIRLAVTLPLPAWLTLAVAAVALGSSALLWRADLIVSAAIPLAGAAILIGNAAALSVQRLTWAVPLLIAAAVGDLWSVHAGTTAEYRLLTGAGNATDTGIAVGLLAGSSEHALDVLFLHLPAAGTIWLVGAVDLVFAALLAAVAVRYRLPLGRTLVALVAPFAASTVVPTGVPLIPLLGVCFAAVHARLLAAQLRFSLQ